MPIVDCAVSELSLFLFLPLTASVLGGGETWRGYVHGTVHLNWQKECSKSCNIMLVSKCGGLVLPREPLLIACLVLACWWEVVSDWLFWHSFFPTLLMLSLSWPMDFLALALWFCPPFHCREMSKPRSLCFAAARLSTQQHFHKALGGITSLLRMVLTFVLFCFVLLPLQQYVTS